MYVKYGKRAMDVILSTATLIFLLPMFLLVALLIRSDDPGPVFFRQNRVGAEKTSFSMLKFRTMKTGTPHDIPTHLLEHPEQYVTRVGRILRKYSLDELPQMLQIWTGAMSIVGPRPALWNQTDLLEERERYGANRLRPGLTGWAQINGRDRLSVADKARYDGEYAARLSFWFDCRCFFGTIPHVLTGAGVAEGGGIG